MKKVFYTWKEVQGAVLDIARQINNSNWRPDYIVGLTRGGLIPAVLLSQYLEVPMKSLDVSLRDGGDTVSNSGMAEDAFGFNELQQEEVKAFLSSFELFVFLVHTAGRSSPVQQGKLPASKSNTIQDIF